MSYGTFGKLKFLDFFPRTELYYTDEDFECPIGLATCEGYGPAGCFLSKPRLEGATCGIDLDFSNGIPEREAHRLLDSLGLPLRKGMPAEKVRNLLGTPDRIESGWLWFVIGSKWPYSVTCACDASGLFLVDVFRKDLVDKEAKLRGQ